MKHSYKSKKSWVPLVPGPWSLDPLPIKPIVSEQLKVLDEIPVISMEVAPTPSLRLSNRQKMPTSKVQLRGEEM